MSRMSHRTLHPAARRPRRTPAAAVIALALAAAVLAACAESPVVEPGDGGAASREVSTARNPAASPTRPAGGTCIQVGRTVLPPEPGQPANVVRREAEWVCQLRHLGRTTAIWAETATITPTARTITGAGSYTAANGDQLFFTYSGTATTPDQNGIVTFSGTETVTGGTGRFAGASGALARTGSASVVILSGQYELRGTLSY